MARKKATIPNGVRLSSHLSIGALAGVYPRDVVDAALEKYGRASKRRRELPAEVVVYLVIALGVYRSYPMPEVLRCLSDGLSELGGSKEPKVPDSPAITFARDRLGVEPLEELRRQVVRPLAEPGDPGCWFHGHRLMAIDGSTLDMPDEKRNRKAFGLAGSSRGATAFPQSRLTVLVEVGTHAVLAWKRDRLRKAETRQAEELMPHLSEEMLVLADRNYFGFPLWQRAERTGAKLLWRVKSNLRLPVEEAYPDGSYRSVIRGSGRDKHKSKGELPVRVIEYRLPDSDVTYRLATNLSPEQGTSVELAKLYHERWEVESVYKEIKAHMLTPGTGSSTALRSKTPKLVRQEIEGIMLAHYALRSVIHKAARKYGRDPDRISFTHTVRVVRRHLQRSGDFPP